MTSSVLKKVTSGAVSLIFIMGLASCRPDLCPEAIRVKSDYQGECLGRVDYYDQRARIEINPHPLCPWERLINLDIFEGFRPGMTIDQAQQRLGPPDVEATRGSDRIWRYRRPKGTVEIGHEDQGSGIIPMYYWWVLRAYPDDRSPHAVFPSEIAAHFPVKKKPYEVVILNQCRLPMADVIIENGEVQAISWNKNPGSYRADRRGDCR